MAERSSVFPAASACSDDASDELSVKDVPKVLKELEQIIDWYSLGTYLEVEAHILDAIQEENPTIKRRMIKMLQHWLRTGRGCSWRKLVEALYQMGKLAVTDNIRRRQLSLTTPVLPKYLSGPEAFVADASTRALLAKKNKQRLMSKFSLLVTRLSQRFDELSVSFVRLQTYLSTFGCEHERFVDDVRHQDTLPQLFNAISCHSIWDYLNFDLAGYLVEGFAQSDQTCLDLLVDYQRDFTGYLLTTEIVHYIAAKRGAGPTATPPESIPSEELCSKLTVKLAIDVTTHSLKYVEEVWKTLLRRSQLPKHTLLLWDIAESSLMITWLFPKSKAAELADAILENTHELQLKRVFSVTIDESEVLQMDVLDQSSAELDINEAGVDRDLVAAANAGNVELVASLLDKGVDVNSSKDEKGCTPLVAACNSGSTELVKLLLERGADVSMPAKQTGKEVYMTPLGAALGKGHEEVAALLIEHGADVNAVGVELRVGEDYSSITHLMVAIMTGLLRSTKLLLERSADVNTKSETNGNYFTPLGVALSNGLEEIAALLIEHGADVNAVGLEGEVKDNTASLTPLTVAAGQGLQHATKLLLECGAEIDTKSEIIGITFTPLGMALYLSYEEVAVVLIEHGADINAVGAKHKVGEVTISGTPLMLAAGKGFQHATKLLLERGAEVDREAEAENEGKSISATALMSPDSAEVAQLLLEYGAEIDFQGSRGGCTALIAASGQGCYEVAEFLLERGAQVDLQDSNGKTALMYAVVKDDDIPDKDTVGLARLLLQHGANPQLEDGKGKTALALAVEHWDTELIELLSDPAKASAPRDTSQHTPRPRTERKKEPITMFGMFKALFTSLGTRS